MQDKVCLIGYGYVGQAYHKVFKDAYIFDEPKGMGTREEVNTCALAVVCVPTPSTLAGACDTSIVEEVVSWLETPLILIKSALEPGTVDRLKEKYGKRICVSVEYVGEGNYFTPIWKYPDPLNPISHGFVVIGGDDKDCAEVMDFLTPILGPTARIRITTALEAEIIKYAENTWGATKVTFAHMLRDVCEKAGANWFRVREGWIDDPRVEVMHTHSTRFT